MRLFSLEKLQNWPKKVKQQQVSCEKMTNVKNENDSFTTTWISSIFRKVCCIQTKQEGPTDNNDDDNINNNNNEKGTLHHITDSGDTSLKHEKYSPVNSSVTPSSTHKQIVSLSPFLEETHTTDRHDFRYRHLITQSFKPMYEVEWKKDQWLRLDKCTNQQIERLRKKGFSKALVRKDPMLMKQFTHDKDEPTILLELSFLNQQDTSFLQQQQQQQQQQQDTSYLVRRVRWWHTSEVGCANVSDSIEFPTPFPSPQGGLHYSEPPYFMQQSSLSA